MIGGTLRCFRLFSPSRLDVSARNPKRTRVRVVRNETRDNDVDVDVALSTLTDEAEAVLVRGAQDEDVGRDDLVAAEVDDVADFELREEDADVALAGVGAVHAARRVVDALVRQVAPPVLERVLLVPKHCQSIVDGFHGLDCTPATNTSSHKSPDGFDPSITEPVHNPIDVDRFQCSNRSNQEL